MLNFARCTLGGELPTLQPDLSTKLLKAINSDVLMP